MKTYLKDFEIMAKKGIAYVPLGVLEWHGNHLPIETDYLVAVKLCEMLAKKIPGYILPPIFLGTDEHKIVKGKKLAGMDRYLGKKLPGNVYYLEPPLFEKMIIGLGETLEAQGFKKIYLVAGHTGTGQIASLARVAKKMPSLRIVDPYDKLKTEIRHADEYETSVLWACHPEEEKISRRRKIPNSDDCFQYYGYDLRKKASVGLGRKILKEMVENCLREIKKYL